MAIRGVLFDWHGTLFHDLGAVEWIHLAALDLGRQLCLEEAALLAQAIGEAEKVPEVQEAHRRQDASKEAHRRAMMLLFRTAGIDAELADALYVRDGAHGFCFPFPDTAVVLQELRERGIRTAVVSDIPYDLRPIFQRHGLDHLIDAWALSFEHGWVKPEPEAFQCALDLLDLRPEEALMVGDRASRDGGAAALGILTLILPTVPNFTNRGLDAVLRLTGVFSRDPGIDLVPSHLYP